MSIHIGLRKLQKMYIGTSEVSKIFVGTDVAYSSAATVLFTDSDLSQLSVSGSNALYKDISWSGNLLPRENYTSTTVTKYTFEYVETDGYMQLNCGDGQTQSGSLMYNSHVCTTQPITIPYGVTKLCASIGRGPTASQLRVGLIHKDATTAFDDTTGSGVQGVFNPGSGVATYSIDVGNRNGSDDYRVVISIRAQRQANYAILRVFSVWFE